MIDKYKAAQSICDRLGIEMEEISKIVEFLKRQGLIKEDRGRLSPTSKYLYIVRNSPFILQHHTNWRLRAIQSVTRNRSSDQHLSYVLTLGEKEAKVIRRLLAELTAEVQEVVKASPEEKMMALNLDFFEV